MADSKKKKIDNTNPFNKGVSYDAFLKELGDKKIEVFLKNKCTKEQIEWLKEEIKHYKSK